MGMTDQKLTIPRQQVANNGVKAGKDRDDIVTDLVALTDGFCGQIAKLYKLKPA